MNHHHALLILATIGAIVYLAVSGCITIPILLVVLLARWGVK